MEGDVPFFKERVGNQVTESDGLHGLIFFEGVEINLLFHLRRECLDISAESPQSHYDIILHFEDSLKIIRDRLHLFAESPIASDANAIFPNHSHQSSSIVLVDWHLI